MQTELTEEEGRKQLLVEGARSYAKALQAINEFQWEIVEECRDVVQRRLAELIRAAGISFTPEVRDYGNFALCRDSKFFAHGKPSLEDPCLGTAVDLGDDWVMYFYLWWAKTSSQAQAVVGLAPRKMDVLRKAHETFKKAGYDFPNVLDWQEFAYLDVLDPNEVGLFPKKLDALIDRWVTLFKDKAVGGIRGLSS
jgi:hypothetical protein